MPQSTGACAAGDACSIPGAKQNGKIIECYGGCDRRFHWKCVGITAASAAACKDNPGVFWLCADCRNSSIAILHRKVSFLFESMESTRTLLRRAETNLESKIVTCYDMISNLAKINKNFYAKQCCRNNSINEALDLSFRSSERQEIQPIPPTASKGKRKLDDSLDGPARKIRNCQRDVVDGPDDIADLPTPTYVADLSSGTSSSPILPANTTLNNPVVILQPSSSPMHPVAATSTVSTGNCTLSICPAEAGRDSAPPIEISPSNPVNVVFDDSGNVTSRTIQSSTHPLPEDQHPPSEIRMETSISSSHTAPPTSLHNNRASINYGPHSVAPVAATHTTSTGNNTNSMCPVEAGHDTALPLRNIQTSSGLNEPSTQQNHTSGQHSNVLQKPPLGQTSSHPGTAVASAQLLQPTMMYSPTNPVAFICENPQATTSPITFPPGKARTGVCPAGALGTAASLSGSQTIPVTPYGRSTNYQQNPAYGQNISAVLNMTSQASPASRSGNIRTGICPAEALDTAAPLRSSQPVPATTMSNSTFYRQCAPIGPPFSTAQASFVRPVIIGNSSHSQLNLPGRSQNSTSQVPQTFQSGNFRTGMCPAGAPGTAAPLSCYQFVPAAMMGNAMLFQQSATGRPYYSTLQVPPTFQSGNISSGICPAEAFGTALPLSGSQPVPAATVDQSRSPRRCPSTSGQSNPAVQFLPQQTPQASQPVFQSGFYNNNAQFNTSLVNNAAQPQQQLTRPRSRNRNPSLRRPLRSAPNLVWQAECDLQNSAFTNSPNRVVVPSEFNWGETLAPPPSYNDQSFATKSFYVKPFDPRTTVDQIAAFIHNKTGWDYSHFNCLRLISESRSDTRPLTFVSFKVTVPDNPSFTGTISNKEFWPSFVNVDSFTTKRRS